MTEEVAQLPITPIASASKDPAATCDTPVSHVECRQPPQETPGSGLVASFQDPSHC